MTGLCPIELHMRVHEAPLTGVLRTPLTSPTGVVIVPRVTGADVTLLDHFVETWHRQGMATFTVDLLSPEEVAADAVDRTLRYRTDWLADRLAAVVDRLAELERLASLPFGILAHDLALGPALLTALRRPARLTAVVGARGRLDVTMMTTRLRALRCGVRLVAPRSDVLSVEHARRILTALPAACDARVDVVDALDQAQGKAWAWFSKRVRSLVTEVRAKRNA